MLFHLIAMQVANVLHKRLLQIEESIYLILIKKMNLQIFLEFDPVPLASASLAQVHAAKTHDGRKVAVKVATLRTISLSFTLEHYSF